MVTAIVLIAVGLALVAAALVFFMTRLHEGDFEHGERLSLLPLADDEVIRPAKRDARKAKKREESECLSGDTIDGLGQRMLVIDLDERQIVGFGVEARRFDRDDLVAGPVDDQRRAGDHRASGLPGGPPATSGP